MDWKVVITTFVLVFVAELGDKTQLMVFARTAETRAPLAVFAGAGTALLASTLLGVLVGGAVSRLPDWVLKGAAALMFTGFGLWTFYDLFKGLAGAR